MPGQFQTVAVARRTVQFNRAHDDRRVQWILPHHVGMFPELLQAESRRFVGDIEQIRSSGEAVVNRRRGEQVPHVVEFVIVRPESSGPELPGGNLRGDVAVVFLRLGDDRNEEVHPLHQRFVTGRGVDVAGGLDPLVDPSILPRHALVFPFFQSGGNLEVAERISVLLVGGALPEQFERTLRLISCLSFQKPPVIVTSSSPTFCISAWGLLSILIRPVSANAKE